MNKTKNQKFLAYLLFKKISNKRATHVGMILSFLIFLTFIAFLYSITQPLTKVDQDKLNTLEYLKIELINEFSEDMTTITINCLSSECIQFESFDESIGEDNGAIIKTSKENIEEKINSCVENKRTTIQGQIEKMKFYYSNQFDKEQEIVCSSPKTALEEDYSIVLFRTTQEIFDSKIIEISEEMQEQDFYQNLKAKLGLAFDDEFGFSFFNEKRELITETNETEVNLNIYSEEIPIQYIDNSNANINPGFLSIRIW